MAQRKHRIMYKRYDIDETYFDKINTKEKAYVLGFLAADGQVELKLKPCHYRLRWNLQKRDKEILVFIKKQLSYTGPISTRGKYVYLEISNKRLVEKAYLRGLDNNKSLTLEPIGIPKKFIGSFIHGYFDGDGCVALYDRGTYMKPYIIFTGTASMMNWIQDAIDCKYKLTKNRNSYNLNVGGFSNICKTINVLRTSSFGLKRKTKILDKIAAYIEKSNRKTQNNGGTPMGQSRGVKRPND